VLSLITRLSENGLFERRVVCVHPAAGADLKQWLPAYFASLINLLTEYEDVNVAMVGGTEEIELSEQLLELIRLPERIFSLVGKLALDELPYFIESCALFVGNDSGPKHPAAALGVPTIGIQSGIVDANEWGPVGELAITIKREVGCAPCYLSKREDCHRQVACLSGLLPTHVLSACRRFLGAGHGIKITRSEGVSAS
jgi:ADP-heptose:LPS heptosyltransferase